MVTVVGTPSLFIVLYKNICGVGTYFKCRSRSTLFVVPGPSFGYSRGDGENTDRPTWLFWFVTALNSFLKDKTSTDYIRNRFHGPYGYSSIALSKRTMTKIGVVSLM